MNQLLTQEYNQIPTDDAYGFYGTIKSNENLSDEAAVDAWLTAFEVFQTAPWSPSDIAIRNFLRSRYGRYYADAVGMLKGELDLEERLMDAACENWVVKKFKLLERDGLDKELLENDLIA